MPSKGLQIYTFIGSPNTQVNYYIPGNSNPSLTRSEQNKFFNDHLEVDKNKIPGPFNFVGRFTFEVIQNGKSLTKQWCDINTLTGNITQGTLKEMEEQLSIVTNDAIVTYWLYDASNAAVAGLPKSDQIGVTVHPNRANWLNELAPPGSSQAGKPFAKLALPSAHDVGMNSMQNAEAIVAKAAGPLMSLLKAGDDVVRTISGKMTDDMLQAIAPNIIRGLAITQKDSLANILAIGARYFEFRPAHLPKPVLGMNPLPDRLYFQHGPITGMAFDQYLHDCVSFLLAHPSEIIVTQLRWDGVPKESAQPSDAEINDYISAALQLSNGALLQGSLDDMKTLTIEQLRTQRKRLVLFKPADSLSTYTDAANATLTGDPIVSEFGKLNAGMQRGKAFTNLQCQATATNIRDVVVYSVTTAGVSNSCLLATKGTCDGKTLPWIRGNALRVLSGEGLVVVMNDFVDGATVETAVMLSKARLG